MSSKEESGKSRRFALYQSNGLGGPKEATHDRARQGQSRTWRELSSRVVLYGLSRAGKTQKISPNKKPNLVKAEQRRKRRKKKGLLRLRRSASKLQVLVPSEVFGLISMERRSQRWRDLGGRRSWSETPKEIGGQRPNTRAMHYDDWPTLSLTNDLLRQSFLSVVLNKWTLGWADSGPQSQGCSDSIHKAAREHIWGAGPLSLHDK